MYSHCILSEVHIHVTAAVHMYFSHRVKMWQPTPPLTTVLFAVVYKPQILECFDL